LAVHVQAVREQQGVPGRSTPGRLRQLLWLLLAGCLAWGAVAAVTADQHASAASDVVAISEPLSLDAEQTYQNLSDADAVAASAFLAGGLEPAAQRDRYNADITAAGVKIESASALVGGSAARSGLPGALASQAAGTGKAVGDDLAILTAELPVYTGEVATARADNRVGLPLGAAYLREADGLLRGELLIAANDIYVRESALLTSASAQATGLPLLATALVLGLALCVAIVVTGRWLSRRTHRTLNTGLLGAFIVGVLALAWLAAAFGIGRSHLLSAQQHGSIPAQTYADAEVSALRAHTDEALTLINNAGDDSYEKDFAAQQQRLGRLLQSLSTNGPAPSSIAGASALTPAMLDQEWTRAHHALRALDNGGNHAAAVQEALTGQAAITFERFSGSLTGGITYSQATFADSARKGRDAFTGLAIGMIVAALLMAAACLWGLNRRLAEYR